MAVNVSNLQVCLKAVQSAQGCAGNVPCVRESMAGVRTLQEWYGRCRNAPECAGVLQDRECGGKWKALEMSKIRDFRGQWDTGRISETITHGPNYQHPPPNLVDNEEEYKVKKILDSQLFCNAPVGVAVRLGQGTSFSGKDASAPQCLA